MKKFINIIAVWILVIAFPVQGFAAATMINCEHSPSNQIQGVTGSHDHAAHSGHDAVTNHSHDTASTDSNAAHHSPSTKHTCSHCAKCSTCCSSITIAASSLSMFSQFGMNNANLAYSAPYFTGFIPAGLERPPRIFLA